MCDILVQKYPTLLDSIGKLKIAEVALHIDMVQKELINLEKQGIIEKVEGPTYSMGLNFSHNSQREW